MSLFQQLKSGSQKALASLKGLNITDYFYGRSVSISATNGLAYPSMDVSRGEQPTVFMKCSKIPKSVERQSQVVTDAPFDVYERLCSVFGSNNTTINPLLIMYHTEFDMSVWSYDSQLERERVTDDFCSSAEKVVKNLTDKGYWCDYIDPSCGLPKYGSYSSETFTECDEDFERLSDSLCLEDLGCCRALKHGSWDFNIMAGLIVTDAPQHVVDEVYRCS